MILRCQSLSTKPPYTETVVGTACYIASLLLLWVEAAPATFHLNETVLRVGTYLSVWFEKHRFYVTSSLVGDHFGIFELFPCDYLTFSFATAVISSIEVPLNMYISSSDCYFPLFLYHCWYHMSLPVTRGIFQGKICSSLGGLNRQLYAFISFCWNIVYIIIYIYIIIWENTDFEHGSV